MKALTALSHSLGYHDMLSTILGVGWLRTEGGVSEQRNTIFSLSLRHGCDCKRRKNLDGTTLVQILALLCYTLYASPYSCHFFVMFHQKLNE